MAEPFTKAAERVHPLVVGQIGTSADLTEEAPHHRAEEGAVGEGAAVVMVVSIRTEAET